MWRTFGFVLQLVEVVLWMLFVSGAAVATLAFAYMYGWLPDGVGTALIERGIPVSERGELVGSTALLLLVMEALCAGAAYGLGKLRLRIEEE